MMLKKENKNEFSAKSLLLSQRCNRKFWNHLHQIPITNIPTIINKIEKETSFVKNFYISRYYSTALDSKIINTKEDLDHLLSESPDKSLSNVHISYKGCTIVIDLLRLKKKELICTLIKSSGTFNYLFVQETALQALALESIGISVDTFYIVTLKASYIRTENDISKDLFIRSNLSKKTKSQIHKIKHLFDELPKIKELKYEPKTPLLKYCFKPFKCEFFSRCWGDISEKSILSLTDYNILDKIELYNKDIKELENLPKTIKTTLNQQRQLMAVKTNSCIIDKDKLSKFLKSLTYPIYHIDFESCQIPIPLWSNTRPFEQIAFQFSIHIQKSPEDIEAKHIQFISDETQDPRPQFVEALLKHIPLDATLMVYDKNFESYILKNLANQFPNKAKQLLKLNQNLHDLMIPFGKGWVYHPKMKGRYTLKHIVKAFVPELSYEKLIIKNGETAASAFQDLITEKNSSKKSEIKESLYEYCKMDTLSMVYILNVFHKLITPK